MAVYVLDIIRSERSDDDIQNELLELLGIENVEHLMELV